MDNFDRQMLKILYSKLRRFVKSGDEFNAIYTCGEIAGYRMKMGMDGRSLFYEQKAKKLIHRMVVGD